MKEIVLYCGHFFSKRCIMKLGKGKPPVLEPSENVSFTILTIIIL